MGIYIKNMKIPSKCIECRLMRRCGKDDLDYVCMPAKVYVEDLTNAYKPRPEYCPLIRVPPHSDLIDRDKLREKEFIHDGDAYAVVMSRDIRNAATIIPADKDDEI